MRNILSLMDFIDSPNNIIFELSKKFKSKNAIYLIEEYLTTHSEIIDGTNYIKVSRYPKINLYETKKNVNFDKEILIYRKSINKVLKRFASQIGLVSPLDYDRALQSLTKTSNELIYNFEINIILFNDYPHTPLEIVIFYLAKLMDLKVYFLFPIPRINKFEERFILLNDFSRLTSAFWEEYDSLSNLDKMEISELPQDLLNYYAEYNENIKKNKFYFGNKTSKYKLITRYIRRIPINLKEHGLINSIKKAKIRLGYILPINAFYRFLVLKYAEKLAIKHSQTYKEKFVFFPLHFQPEATTIPWGNIYSDQLYAITEISKNLPRGYFLYIKEHPAYWARNYFESFGMYRSRGFYKKISEFENVKIVSHTIPSYEIIDKSECVITVTGTIAWECFYKSVPCVVLGDIYYKDLPTSSSPDQFDNDMSLTLENALAKKGNDYSQDFKKFLFAFNKISILTENPIKQNHSWNKPFLSSNEESDYSSTNKIKADFIYNQLK